MNTEKVLFRVPRDSESLLAAIATMQDYVLQRVKEVELQITIQNAIPEHDYLLDTIPYVETISHVCEPVPRGEYELVYVFDPNSAYNVARATKAHITEVFGHQIGCVPLSIPTLTKLLPENYQPTDCVGILTNKLYDDIGKLVLDAKIPAEWIEWSETTQILTEDAFKRIASCSVLIGAMSSATYAAAALGRYVIEIYPTTVHKEWLSKWAAEEYKMVYTSKPDPQALAKVVEETWRTRKTAVIASA